MELIHKKWRACQILLIFYNLQFLVDRVSSVQSSPDEEGGSLDKNMLSVLSPLSHQKTFSGQPLARDKGRLS